MKTVTLTLPEEDIFAIASALAELPYRVSAPIIARLQAQLSGEAQGEASHSVTESDHAD
jgi:hypothetical protein